jgi:hypothetical protein
MSIPFLLDVRQDVSTSVLSLLGSFCWIESQPVEVEVQRSD